MRTLSNIKGLHFGTLSNIKGLHFGDLIQHKGATFWGPYPTLKGLHFGTLSNIKHKVNLIVWKDPQVIVVGGMDLMPIRKILFPIAINRPKTPPPSVPSLFFRGDIQKYKGGSPYILPNFCTFASRRTTKPRKTHNLENKGHNFVIIFIRVSHNTYIRKNRRAIWEFNQSTPKPHPTLPKEQKKEKKRCLSIVINSYPEEFSWKRFSPGDVADRHTREKAPTSHNKLHFPAMHKWRGLVISEEGLRDLHLGFKDLHLGVSLGPRWVPFFFFSPFGLVLFL